MPRKGKAAPEVEELRGRANQILGLIAAARQDLEWIQGQAEAELARIREVYRPRIEQREEALAGLEKALRALMRQGGRAVFDECDRVDLAHGSLVYIAERVVVKVKGMLDRLKALGRPDAVKTVESVKWEALEGWSDEELAQVGTRREERESYSYEIREEKR